MEIGIVGLGLIGGSMAKAIQAHTDHRVFGYDRDTAAQAQALDDGAIDGVLDERTLRSCRLLLLALYPSATVDFVTQNAEHIGAQTRVVDLCGVKRYVCDAINPIADRCGFYFVGGHPMAGRERSGYGVSSASLYQGASMLLTPGEKTPNDVLDELEQFFLTLGFGTVSRTEAEEHDSMIAYTSQLAHVLSNAYVKSPRALRHKQFSGGSFQDLTRVATLNETMWSELFLHNRDHLIEEIDALCARLSAYGDALRASDETSLRALLREGCQWKERIAQGRE